MSFLSPPVSLIFNSSECRLEDSLAIKDELDSPSLRAVLVAAVYLVSKFGKTLHQHKASAWASVENKEGTKKAHRHITKQSNKSTSCLSLYIKPGFHLLASSQCSF